MQEIYVHFSTEQISFRGYTGGDESSYLNRDRFDLIGQIKLLDGREAHVSGVKGPVSHGVRRQVIDHLRSLGVTLVRWEHNGREREFSI